MEFNEADQFITSLDHRDARSLSHAYAFENGIARARHLLARLGGANHIIHRCVIVTGSKGKGSTTMLIAHVLASAGYKVGVFTGPHLHCVVERFGVLQADGAAGCRMLPMAGARFAGFASKIRQIVQTWDAPALGLPTRFEAYTTMAYRWFEECACDIALFEVGIGGRNDTTNLGEPLVSVFTNISLEHTALLGGTVERIAREKAGIMRAKGCAVSAQQLTTVRAVLRAEAHQIGCPIFFADEHWHVSAERQSMLPGAVGQWLALHSLPDDGGERSTAAAVFLPLLGAVQLQNAATALTALDVLRARGFISTMRHVRAGFAGIRWPGRFEVLHFEPLVIADGAHTPYSAEMLARTLKDYFADRRVHVVIAVLRDKDARGMLQQLAPVAYSLALTEVDNRRAVSVDQLGRFCLEVGVADKVVACTRACADAVRGAVQLASGDDVVCITGSLHLVAEAQTCFQRLYS